MVIEGLVIGAGRVVGNMVARQAFGYSIGIGMLRRASIIGSMIDEQHHRNQELN